MNKYLIISFVLLFVLFSCNKSDDRNAENIPTNESSVPIKIKTWQDFENIKYNLNGNYILTRNLKMPKDLIKRLYGGGFGAISLAEDQQPAAGYQGHKFTGIFDGNGKKISNVIMKSPHEYTGLFGYLDGVVKNLTIENADIMGKNIVGVVAGVVGKKGKLENIKVIHSKVYGIGWDAEAQVELKDMDEADGGSFSNTTDVTDAQKIGGVAGINNGQIKDVEFYGSVFGNLVIGGLVGENNGGLEGNASLSIEGYDDVGGLVGINNGAIIGSVSSDIDTDTIRGKHRVGGIVGHNTGSIQSVSHIKVLGIESVGGIAGYNTGVIMGINKGKVVGDYMVGGIVGDNYFTSAKVRAYNTGAVRGKNNVGGLVGFNYNGSLIGYESGILEVDIKSNKDIGAIVGKSVGLESLFVVYWDIDMTGFTEEGSIEAVSSRDDFVQIIRGISAQKNIIVEGDTYIDSQSDDNTPLFQEEEFIRFFNITNKKSKEWPKLKYIDPI